MIDCEKFFEKPNFPIPPKFPSFERLSAQKDHLRTVLDLEPGLCDLHNNEERRIVCLECHEVVCVRCLLDSHQSHLWSDLDEILAQVQRFTELDDISVSGCLSQSLERKRKLIEDKTDFFREVASSEQAIFKAGRDLKDLVDRHTEALLDELSQLKMRKLEEIENEKQEVEKELKILELFYHEIVEKFADNDLCVTKNAFVLKTAAGDLDLTLPASDSSCNTAMIAFQEANILEQLKANSSNLLGRLKTEFDLKDRQTDEQFRNALRLTDFPDEAVGFRSTTLETEECHVTAQLTAMLDTAGCNVFGVAAMQNQLYVLLSNSILIFGAQPPFDRVDAIKAPSFMYPFDLAACPLTLRLYVPDDGHCCVWKVDKDRQVTKFLEGTGEPSTISVSIRTGHVTLLKSGVISVLEVFDQNGESVKVITLPEEVIEPQHAVMMSTGEIVLCFRQRNKKVWCVCLLTTEGDISICCELRDALHHLAATPCHLALDEFDRVFVADWQRKVDLFDSELNWDRTLVSSQRDGIERPERICYDRINKLLLVVHGWGKKTYVYRYNTKDISYNCNRVGW